MEQEKKWPVITAEAWEKIEHAVKDTLFGSVTLVVQNSKVIQIDRVEKIRLC